VTSGAGTGNLAAALAEAAFMCGFERNADVITMTSYAPLFVNVNDRKWNPDLICFDSARSYGTPSYFVQQMFAGNRPDKSFRTDVSADPAPFEPPAGKIGLGTWRTQAEYKDVKVTQGDKVLFEDDFSRGASRWSVARGQWSVVDGAYRQTGNQENLRALAGEAGWKDYTLSLKARKLGGSEGFLVMFRSRDDRNWYWWNIGGWNNIQHAVQKEVGGAPTQLTPYVPGRVETNRWYDIKIELAGPRIRCWLDGKLIHDFEERNPNPLTATAGRTEKTGEIILKVVNNSTRPQEVDITLEGIGTVSPRGTAIVLSSESPADENSFGSPKKIAPKRESLADLSSRFRRTFPANSLTVIRVGGK
jgi:alpha-L-arabinofuranosidase